MKKCLLILLVLLVVMAGHPAIVFSKTDSTSKKALVSSTLETVLVSASRLPSFKRKPEDYPASLSLKNIEQIHDSHPATFQDTVKDLEGIHVFDQTGNGVDEVFTLRGFVEGSDTVFLLDGVRINEVDGFSVLLPLIRTDNLGAIEISRGSSSAVYGSGAFAGVVNLTTRPASKKPFSFFGGTDWSSFRGIHFYDGVSGTIQDKVSPLEGSWNYYLTIGRDQKRGFRSNGEFRDTTIDFKTAYELPDDEGGLRFGFKNVNDAISNPGALTLKEYTDDYSQSFQTQDGRKMENKILFLNGNKRFLDQRLNTSLQGSIRRRTSRFYTTTRTFTDFVDGFDPDTDLVTTRSREHNVIGQVTFQDGWDWLTHESLVGAEFTRGGSHDKRQDAFRGNVVETTRLETLRDGETTALGIFANERIKLWDKFSTDFGIRGSYHWTAIVDRLNHMNDFNRKWRNLSISIGNVYEPTKWSSLFWNYAQAFRVPQFSDINAFGGDASANLNEETADSFEVGTRLKRGDRLQAKFSYFEIITHDEIVFDSSAITSTNQFGQNVNVGRTRRNGVEANITWKVAQELSMYGTYALTRAIAREGVMDPVFSGSPFANRSLGQVPLNRWTFGVHSKPLQRFGSPYDGLKLLLNAVIVGRQQIQSFESTTQSLLDVTGGTIKPYHIWDAKVAYEWRGHEVFLKVNNLFDQRYFSRAVAATSFGTQTTPAGDYLFVTPGAPREFVLGVRYEF